LKVSSHYKQWRDVLPSDLSEFSVNKKNVINLIFKCFFGLSTKIHFPITRAPSHYAGTKSLRGTPNNVTSTFFNSIHLHPKDLRFEHEGAKLASCTGRHLTSLCPWFRAGLSCAAHAEVVYLRLLSLFTSIRFEFPLEICISAFFSEIVPYNACKHCVCLQRLMLYMYLDKLTRK